MSPVGGGGGLLRNIRPRKLEATLGRVRDERHADAPILAHLRRLQPSVVGLLLHRGELRLKGVCAVCHGGKRQGLRFDMFLSI